MQSSSSPGHPSTARWRRVWRESAGRFVVLVEVGVGQRRDLTSTLEEIEWLTLADRVAGVVIVSNRPAPAGEGEKQPTHLDVERSPDISGAAREQL